MMTTNKLTKTFASGSLALGVLAGSVLTATSASASGNDAILSWLQWTNGNPLKLHNGATATFVGKTADFEAQDLNAVSLTFSNDEYSFGYTRGFANTNNFGPGSFTYKITLPTPILGVSNDSDVSSTYGNVTTTFDKISNILVSNNGAPDPANGFEPALPPIFNELLVTNALFNPNPNEFLTSLSNGFETDTPSVPEPGTILGLLAVGGLGMVSRFKKQK